jgi:FAD/FMN-containing dehydrogenase
MNCILNQLKEVVDDSGILTGDAVSERIAVWGTNQPMQAVAIVRSQNTQQVAAILKICNDNEQAVVPQGGMTGLVKAGMPSANEIAFSMERMNSIIDIDSDTATMTVEAGVTLQEAQEAAGAYGLMLPLDLGARGSATIGGNLSANAGGNRVIRYGMTREMVLGIEAVLADGTILSSLNKVLKNNTGYELKQLFVGGEGTLGVITKAVLRLRPKPRSENTAFVSVDGFDKVVKLLRVLDIKGLCQHTR